MSRPCHIADMPHYYHHSIHALHMPLMCYSLSMRLGLAIQLVMHAHSRTCPGSLLCVCANLRHMRYVLPTGTGCSWSSNTYSWVLAMGGPMGLVATPSKSPPLQCQLLTHGGLCRPIDVVDLCVGQHLTCTLSHTPAQDRQDSFAYS